MNNNIIFALLPLLLIVSIPLASAQYMGAGSEEFAKEKYEREMLKDISISLNKNTVFMNQEITITLSSDTFMSGQKINMEVFDKNNNLVNQWYIPVRSSDAIVFPMGFSSSDYEQDGLFTLKATYDDASDESKFVMKFLESRASPQVSFNDTPEKFEGLNELDGEKDRMITKLEVENTQLKADLLSINDRLDSMNQVLMEQVRVISELASAVSDLKRTVAEFFTFDIFA